jgi:hypothetical protein
MYLGFGKDLLEASRMENMVDERVELCSLVCRFKPDSGHNEIATDYQCELQEKFVEFADHPAVEFLKEWDIDYDAIPRFAFHIEKKDGEFIFIEDLQCLLESRRWAEGRAKEFLKLLNDFYKVTNYAEFYNTKVNFFEEETQKFIDVTYSKIDFEWFNKYLNMSLRICIHSPSLSRGNYGGNVGKYFYAVVPMKAMLVHEYCHAFADPIAGKWYAENPKFKKMCDDTAALKKIPWYSSGETFAIEYVTNAYNILYNIQHGENIEDEILWIRNYHGENSFPYIQEIYNMIVDLESETI